MSACKGALCWQSTPCKLAHLMHCISIHVSFLILPAPPLVLAWPPYVPNKHAKCFPLGMGILYTGAHYTSRCPPQEVMLSRQLVIRGAHFETHTGATDVKSHPGCSGFPLACR